MSQKLVFVNRFFYPDISATSQMLTDAAFSLAETHFEVHIVTSRLQYEGEGLLPAYELIDDVHVHRIWTTHFGRANLFGRALDYLTFYISVFLRLLSLLRPDDHVVAKTDPPLVSIPVGWAARIRGARHYNWLQDLFPEVAVALGMNLPRWLTGLLAWLRNGSLQNARSNIVIGQLMRTRLLKEGVYAGYVGFVPNWADGEAIVPISDSDNKANPLREAWGLDDKFVVGYSGNLGRAHEIETLLAAIRRLQDDDGIVFLFIGGGALMDELKAIVQQENLGNCLFKPYQPRDALTHSLALPDVHLAILRPELEGLIVPSKIYGIFAAGRPCIFIGAQDGEVAQLLVTEEAGTAISLHDAAALESAILHLRDDTDHRLLMGRNARQLFERRFTRESSVALLEEYLC